MTRQEIFCLFHELFEKSSDQDEIWNIYWDHLTAGGAVGLHTRCYSWSWRDDVHVDSHVLPEGRVYWHFSKFQIETEMFYRIFGSIDLYLKSISWFSTLNLLLNCKKQYCRSQIKQINLHLSILLWSVWPTVGVPTQWGFS